MSERTFIAVKPDGVQRGLVGEIIARFERRGYQLVALKFVKPDVELVKQHYDEHKERPFFGGLVDFLSGGAVAAMVFQGENVIAAGRKMIGSTKPSDSAPGTIRGDFGITVGRNIIHGSDGAEAAAREIGLWFSESELVDWKQTQDVHLYE